MEGMFYQYYVFIFLGMLAVSRLVSGVRILEKSGIEMTFLKGGILNITCEHPTASDLSKDLIFTVNGKSNISAFSPAFSFENGMSKLFLQKQVVVDDTGSYSCGFDSEEDSVIVQVFEDSKLHDQKRFMRDSTDLTEGEELTLHCPVLDKLKATITWSFVDGTLRSDRILTDIGDKVENGKITIADVKVEDRGRYSCTAVWYSGQATFKHLVRVKSRLAPLWPAIGIIVEVLVLVVIVFACKDRKKKKDTEPLSSPSTSEKTEDEKGNRRKYATSST